MQDEQIRTLERLVLSGDQKAAITYYKFLKRAGNLTQPQFTIPVQRIELVGSRIRGLLDLHPISGTELLLNNDQYVRINEPLLINNRLYEFRGRYYFEPSVGWTPYPPETVEHARWHVNRNLEWSKQRGEETLGQQHTLTYWLPQPYHQGGNCFSCGPVMDPESNTQKWIGTHLHLNHLRYSVSESLRPGTANAIARLDTLLKQIIPEWVANHPEIMRQVQLNFLQNQKARLDDKLVEVYNQQEIFESQMAEIIAEDLRLRSL